MCVCVLTETPAPVRMRMRFLVRNKSTTSCGELYALNRSRSRRLEGTLFTGVIRGRIFMTRKRGNGFTRECRRS